MINKFTNSIKTVSICCFVLVSIIACEKDFENINTDLIDNSLFKTKSVDFEVLTTTKNIEKSRVKNLTLYSLGIYKNKNFGVLKSSFISQVSAPAPPAKNKPYFGLNPTIDTVILDIPYFSKRDGKYSNNKPKFKLDSIDGDQSIQYKLTVKRLTTFLNTLDPANPSKLKTYYSNENYQTSDILSTKIFKPDRNDTMLVVKRLHFASDPKKKTDTIKKPDKKPSIKLPLDKNLINQIFVTNANSTPSNFASFDNFSQYFRGILIEPEMIGNNVGSIMRLAMNNAVITVYYTDEVLTDETKTDLNGDGDTDDKQVPVKTKQKKAFPLGGIRAAVYNRNNYNEAIADLKDQISPTPSSNNFAKLYVQENAGTIAELNVQITEANLTNIRNQNWLINGAFLDFYVEDDDVTDNENVPSRLYLYKIEEPESGKFINTTIKDVISERKTIGIGGILKRKKKKPYRYRFSITDYMSDVLKSKNPSKLFKFGLKAYHPTDAPKSSIDTIVKEFSWRSKGVVLKGNNIDESDTENYNKRLKLTIYYTTD